MGVEYCVYLLPRDNTVRPSPGAVAKLIEAWVAHRYVRAPNDAKARESVKFHYRPDEHAKQSGAYVETEPGKPRPLPLVEPLAAMREVLTAPEVIIVWPIHDTMALGLDYPLDRIPDMGDPKRGPYLDLRLEISDDFVDRGSECIDGLYAARCTCGRDLRYHLDHDLFYAGRIKRLCPTCGAAFRPQDHETIVGDGMTGERTSIAGGATSRFAIVVDCGKAWNRDAPTSVLAKPTFVTLCETSLGTKLYQVSDYY